MRARPGPGPTLEPSPEHAEFNTGTLWTAPDRRRRYGDRWLRAARVSRTALSREQRPKSGAPRQCAASKGSGEQGRQGAAILGAPWMIVGNAAPAWARLQGLCTADQPLEVAGRLRVVPSLRSGWPSRAPRDASRVRRGPSPRCETSPGSRLRSEVPEPPHSPSVRQFPVETVAQADGCRRAETRRIPWSSCRSHPPWHRDLGPRTRPRERDLHLRSPSESLFS
jgi:hypothetical protein